MRRSSMILTAFLLGAAAGPATAQVGDQRLPSPTGDKAAAAPLGTAFTYQGRLLQSGSPVNGNVDLTFTIYDSPGGAVIAGPDTILGVPVTNGLFTVELDFGPGVFGLAERWMEVQVNGTPLSPLQLMTAAPVAQYALNADGGAIMNIDASNITSGTLPNGRLSGSYSNPLFLNSPSNTYNGTGLTIETSTLVADGGSVGIGTSSPSAKLHVQGDSYTSGRVDTVNRIALLQSLGGNEFASLGNNASGGGVLRTYDEFANQTVIMGSTSSGGGGFMNMHMNASIWPGVALRADAYGAITLNKAVGSGFDTMVEINANFDGNATFYQADGDLGVRIDGNSGTLTTYGSDGQMNTRLWNGTYGELNLYDGSASNDQTVKLSATSSSGGDVSLYTSTGTRTLYLDGQGNNGAGELLLYDSSGQSRFEVDAGLDGVFFRMSNVNGTPTVNFVGDETETGQGSALKLFNGAGVQTIELDADFGSGTGNGGRIITDEVQITGGADLSEQFDVASRDIKPEPGMVVSIDPAAPGKLRVCDTPHDRMVAGVISGANGIRPGLLMGQRDSEADGRLPVALTGRVYVKCDASNGSIQPGDLLTTADMPGHAMKVTDHVAAQGAIIGKAMTALDGETGLVLVLVSLQ